MELQVITHEELTSFREALLHDIKQLLIEHKYHKPARKWLKSHEVRRLLTVSPGTLQHLRVSGQLPYIKVGNIIFYEYQDIEKMLETNKVSY
ncbi:helix-turn-helix domain-containing protein [Fulvivirga maritima]|uniref:helix-turn-helix domain-containing protein n=1 Tax=Fulvivirga maritima TaxID=2904247 RepID=UPI001F381AD3|nr:helix-turn-helix domain-containing protein [Fulvivirga maritima]UII29072.1 helix-turn-helix domain-containing protein [Fulvivirga maritima]